MTSPRRGAPLGVNKRKMVLLSDDDEPQPHVILPDNSDDEDFELDDDEVQPRGRTASARKKKGRSSMLLIEDDEEDRPPSPPRQKRKHARKATLSTEPTAQEATPAPPEPEEELTEEARAAREEEQLRGRWMEEYFEIVEQLPLELHRSYALMRELEEQMQDHVSSIVRDINAYKQARLDLQDHLASGATTAMPSLLSQQQRRHLLSQISSATNEAVRAAEEKVGLAVTVYDWVDRHVRRLDVDETTGKNSLLLGLRPGTQESRGVQEAQGALNMDKTQDASAATAPEAAAIAPPEPVVATPKPKGKKGRGGRKRAKDPTPVPTLLEGPAFDPNEPTYCYCDRPSYDDMVACENDECPREWFHYACVGLTAAPRGKWYCQFCAAKNWKGPGTLVPPKANFKPPKR